MSDSSSKMMNSTIAREKGRVYCFIGSSKRQISFGEKGYIENFNMVKLSYKSFIAIAGLRMRDFCWPLR